MDELIDFGQKDGLRTRIDPNKELIEEAKQSLIEAIDNL